jgi:hypothetical protein
MAFAFGMSDVLTYRIDSRSKTGSVLSITASSTDGKLATLTGETFRSRTKLPSRGSKIRLTSSSCANEFSATTRGDTRRSSVTNKD